MSMVDGEFTARYGVTEVIVFASKLFQAAGLEADKAAGVAEILVEADLLGHATHGLALAPWYLDGLASGAINRSGEPQVVSDRGACVSWRGNRLPGAWLAAKAVDVAVERAATYGTVTMVLADCGHIGALAAYLRRATERGYMIILASSTPSSAGVAPYGGTRAVLTPNPLAAGIPTRGDPVLIDISASITTMNRARQLTLAGRMFPQPWALDAQGNPSDDPEAVVSRGGSLLPVGGLDHGHKGFGLAILVEALTQALAGFGRADHPKGSSVSVYLQVIDPDAFGGQDGFTEQSTFLADTCRSSPPRPDVDRVRMPGERALALRKAALAEGVPLSSEITTPLASRARGFGLPFPSSRNS